MWGISSQIWVTQKQGGYIYILQIRELVQDKEFDEDLNKKERNAWLSFKRICKDFLGNHKAANYQDVVQDLLTSYKVMGSNMSLKVHFLESHLLFSQENLREVNDEHWNISPRHYDYGKAVPRPVDVKYVCRLLLYTEDGCTWRQIPAKFIRLYILEEIFCMLHEHVTQNRQVLAWRTSYLESLHPLKTFSPTLRGPNTGLSLVSGTTSTCETHTYLMRQTYRYMRNHLPYHPCKVPLSPPKFLVIPFQAYSNFAFRLQHSAISSATSE